MNYSQTFQLLPDGAGSYYIFNDIFKLVFGWSLDLLERCVGYISFEDWVGDFCFLSGIIPTSREKKMKQPLRWFSIASNERWFIFPELPPLGDNFLNESAISWYQRELPGNDAAWTSYHSEFLARFPGFHYWVSTLWLEIKMRGKNCMLTFGNYTS